LETLWIEGYGFPDAGDGAAAHQIFADRPLPGSSPLYNGAALPQVLFPEIVPGLSDLLQLHRKTLRTLTIGGPSHFYSHEECFQNLYTFPVLRELQFKNIMFDDNASDICQHIFAAPALTIFQWDLSSLPDGRFWSEWRDHVQKFLNVLRMAAARGYGLRRVHIVFPLMLTTGFWGQFHDPALRVQFLAEMQCFVDELKAMGIRLIFPPLKHSKHMFTYAQARNS
jgi:hypothetical protein